MATLVTVAPQLFPDNYSCPHCAGLGFVADENATGWATVCDCSDTPGVREYRPELCDDFLQERSLP